MVRKSSSVWTSLLLGAAGGAAAAAFLATKSGKAVKEKVVNFANVYKENHEEINADLVSKAQDFGKQATERFAEVKTQLETGELTLEDLVKAGKDRTLETLGQLKEKITEQNLSTTDILEAIKTKTKASAVDGAGDIEEAIVVSEDIEIAIDDVVVAPVPKEAPEAKSEIVLEKSEEL
ncbi:YtxH domain-containing protein [Streptococcus ruminantium]|uniref:YtxH domain-containing protein n=1 Tax=Streptococcus ruminantium TaxID=1917441 RepID=UPI0012DFAB99|nr:YtxH domain-containing protein [Streptococcus ruminantium]